MPVSVSEAKGVSEAKAKAKSKLIQEGSYGCAFTPPLPCKKSRASSTERQVGKIIKKQHANIELSISTLIHAIPGWQRYFLIQEEDTCTSKNFAALRDEYENQCKTLRKAKDSSLLQLLSPHGGTSLFDLTLTNTFDYIGSLRHMLEGVQKLQTQGICHYDLHEANILVDTRGTFRMIDFGAAFVGPEVSNKSIWRHIYDFQPEYAPQPPELSVQNGLHQGLSYNYTIQQTIAQKKVFKQLERLLGVPVVGQAEALDGFWRNTSGDWPSFFHAHWASWDTWAVGVIFLKLLEKCFLLPAFVNVQWASKARELKAVLKGLLNVDPTKRMSAEAALKVLNA
jgi:serine/threonine protein kinase